MDPAEKRSLLFEQAVAVPVEIGVFDRAVNKYLPKTQKIRTFR